MKPLILYPTETCHWQALLNEAQVSTNLILNENMESYLVFLLMRFVQKPELFESILGLDYLESIAKTRSLKIDALREIGDKSLLFCGLFPGIALKRRVSLNYFQEIGQAAYSTIGELQNEESASLYLELSAQFKQLQQILQAMRGDFSQTLSAEKSMLSDFNTSLQ